MYVARSSAVLLCFITVACVAQAVDYTQYDSVVDPILQRMTLAEKVGQMTQAEVSALADKSEIAELALGSVLSGGNADPADGNSARAWADMYDDCQRAAVSSRLGIPILYGVDAVHGHSNVLDAVIFPHNIGLGCANDVDLIEEINRVTALEIRATGINWNFAPCVTVPRDDRWGRTYEGFSEDPERVARLGAAAVRGLQSSDLRDPSAVLACAKHFVGDGGTVPERKPSQFNVDGEKMAWDQGDVQCDEETLRRVHVSPYLPTLEEGVGSIMPSYSSWNGVKCTGNKALLTDLLKVELGFDGFLISDYNAIDQCHPDFKTAVGIAINAGIDMSMSPVRYKEYITVLTELVEEGVVPMSRIDDAVRRILRVKAAMGLLDADANVLTDSSFMSGLGSQERRNLAREAAAKSAVLLKNSGVLPLNTSSKYHVAGIAADDVGIQCGGWTIDWQGKAGDVTTGTTILEALRDQVGSEQISYGSTEVCSEAEANIVVVGELPYAEGEGDSPTLAIDSDQMAVVQAAMNGDRPVVLVILSGRPVVIPPAILEGVDAVVAAWLPGSEGAGVADVLTGSVEPSGTLSFSWPRTADQHPINVGDSDYDPLFPVGYGLRYPVEGASEQTGSFAR